MHESQNVPERYREEYLAALDGTREFENKIVYDDQADSISHFVEDAAYNGVWTTPFLTVYVRADGRGIVGFKLKSVKAILELLNREDSEFELLSEVTLKEVVEKALAAMNRLQSNNRPVYESGRLMELLRNPISRIAVGSELAKAA